MVKPDARPLKIGDPVSERIRPRMRGVVEYLSLDGASCYIHWLTDGTGNPNPPGGRCSWWSLRTDLLLRCPYCAELLAMHVATEAGYHCLFGPNTWEI